ncbi:MAG: cadherin repeat domain-containing protein [Proteobacteria bacterium]|nr:cadherin repeat domain-containing protein [Pseudomonadota bacterium]
MPARPLGRSFTKHSSLKSFSLRHFLLALIAALVFMPGLAWAQSTVNIYTVANGDSGTGWSFASGVLTVTGDVTITGIGICCTSNRIVVAAAGGPKNITLGSGVNIDTSGSGSSIAFDMTGATVHLTLVGTNTLKSASGRAGLQAPAGATLTIGGAGKLTATGSGNGAGIGGGNNQAGGNITINSGEVEANGGGIAAGIGGGYQGSGGNITINGGTVTAKGGTNPYFAGAGIGNGGANTSDGFITITGGTVTAIGGNASAASSGAAGIGCGSSDYGDLVIVISGGAVEANGGSRSGPGIGSGSSGTAGSSITITGDATVNAKGGDAGAGNPSSGGGAGIGTSGAIGSEFFPVGTITIDTTGTVTAIGGSSGWGGAAAPIGQGGINNGGDGSGISPIAAPADKTVAAGGNTSFNVTVTTAGPLTPTLAYQWQVSTNGGANWSNATNGTGVAGATTATLNLTSVTAGMNDNLYRCAVTVSGMDVDSSIVYTTHSGLLTVTGATTYNIGFTTNGIAASGITATGTISPASPQAAGTAITVTVTLTGTAAAAGTHTVGLTSATLGAAGITAPANVTKVVTTGQAMTAADTFAFTFTMPAGNVTDLVVTHTFSAASVAPTITSTNNASFTEGVGGSFNVTATGSGTVTYSLTGTVPTGCSINNTTGVITVAASVTANVYLFTVVASNGTSPDAMQPFTLTINAASATAPTITTPGGALMSGTSGSPYSTTLTATNNPTNWSVAPGSLPPGLSLSNSGMISGTPGAVATATTYNFTIIASNAAGDSAPVSYNITISPLGGHNFPAQSIPTLNPVMRVLLIVALAGLTLQQRRRRV